jgi:hypothetical protein
MRYKIKTPTDQLFQEVRNLVANETEILVESKKRGFLSVEEVSEDLESRLRSRGATVTPDFQYDID